MLKFLGTWRGTGDLRQAEQSLGRADFEFDGFLSRPGEVVASGELRMPPASLAEAVGRRTLELVTDEGPVLTVRFTGKISETAGGVIHVEVGGQLPPPAKWRRR